VAELADAQDLKSCVLTDVRVQVPPRVLSRSSSANNRRPTEQYHSRPAKFTSAATCWFDLSSALKY